jgi:hypothetical protein
MDTNIMPANNMGTNNMAANNISAKPEEECLELKNINYKNMLLTGVQQPIQRKNENIANIANIDLFLDKESKMNKNEPWNKLDKTDKIKQLCLYVDGISEAHALTQEEADTLKQYLTMSLDKKKLQCVKDVQYDKVTGKIKTISILSYNPVTRKFTLKRSEKRASTLKSLGKGQSRKKTEII